MPVDFDRSSDKADNSSIDIEVDYTHADPGTICERIGASPYQPFPAVLISNYNVKDGIVHGTLSQNVFYHNYIVEHENNKLNFNILSSFKGIDALEMNEGRVIIDEWYIGTTNESDDIEKIFEGYANVLRKKLPVNYGRTDINRKSMLWGSWNDGTYRDINEDIMLEEAKFISENFPTVEWIQLDDGYSISSTKVAHGLGVPYEGDEGIDPSKFPNGFRSMTDKIRMMGVRPSIWVGGFCPHVTPIYQDHPDWFIDYSLRVGNTSPLDVSQPEVREYMLSAIDTIFGKYGFEGVKHDFWSYAFEDSHNLFKNKDRSGYEYRRWWLTNLRNRLAKDGYMQTGCDLCHGNPFLSEFFTNYRYGPDVGSGNWENVKVMFEYGISAFAPHTGDLFPSNSDSIGIIAGLTDSERELLINYCITTHSLVELSGKLSKFDDKKKIKGIKKAICNPNNGQDFYCVGFDYRCKKVTYPEVMYFNTPHFSIEENNPLIPLKTVSFFNISEETKTYSLTLSDIKLPDGDYELTDVWTGETFEFKDFSVTLDAHHSRMFAVTDKNQAILIDANVRVNNAFKCGEKLVINTDYAEKEAELTLAVNPSKITFDGNDVAFEVVGGKTCFALPGKGTLEVQ